MPPGAEAQVAAILDKVQAILRAADLATDAVVEMTSYHTRLRAGFDSVEKVLRRGLGDPIPAWTAVEVNGLRRPGAVIEIRFILYAPAAAGSA